MAYRCIECGYETAKWMGFCPQCRSGGLAAVAAGRAAAVPPTVLSIEEVLSQGAVERTRSGLAEVDRVLGGGFVAGSSVLVSGEPGIGKSTLLLQVAGGVCGRGRALIVSAEESIGQIALRAERIGVRSPGLSLATETDVDAIVACLESIDPDLLVVDSVQTVAFGEVDGRAGSIGQVRESTGRLVAAAKAAGVPIVLVGHVTKDGSLAGPKLLEHMVDVVLRLDGDDQMGVRFLRATKNRFGSVDRVGVMEMTDSGFVELEDPGSLFVNDEPQAVAGTALFPTFQGRRPFLVEIQALTNRTHAAMPRRSVKGIDSARLHQLLAVLDRHAGLDTSRVDVYVNVVGGVRIGEPAADLPVALALSSALLNVPLERVAAWGEVGLTGELRPATHDEARHEEAGHRGIRTVVAAGSHLATLADAFAVLDLYQRPRLLEGTPAG